MISFKEFLNEGIVKKWDQATIEAEHAIALLNQHCKDGLKAIDNGGLIWRGIANNNLGTFAAVDSSTGFRTSRDSHNIYQAMMDASSELKEFPSRSKSFICSTDISTAEGFAVEDENSKDHLYAFIPFDGTKIALSPARDMFETIITTPLLKPMYGVDSADAWFTRWLRDLKINPSDQVGNRKQFIDVSKVDAALAKVSDKVFLKSLQNAFWVKEEYLETIFDIFNKDPKKRMTSIASYVFTPKTMKLQLKTFGEKLPKDREVWFSGKAVAIRYDVMQEIMTIIKKEKKSGIR